MHFPQVRKRAAVDSLAVAQLQVEGEEKDRPRLLAPGQITELQNQTILWVGRDPLGSLSPTLKWMAHAGVKHTTLVLLALSFEEETLGVGKKSLSKKKKLKEICLRGISHSFQLVSLGWFSWSAYLMEMSPQIHLKALADLVSHQRQWRVLRGSHSHSIFKPTFERQQKSRIAQAKHNYKSLHRVQKVSNSWWNASYMWGASLILRSEINL